MHEPGTLTVDASIADQMIAGREEIIASLKRENDLLQLASESSNKAYAKLLEAFDTQSAENAHLRQEIARLKESANKDRDILNAVVEAVSRREK